MRSRKARPAIPRGDFPPCDPRKPEYHQRISAPGTCRPHASVVAAGAESTSWERFPGAWSGAGRRGCSPCRTGFDRDLLRLISVVRAASKLEIPGRRLPSRGKRYDVMELEDDGKAPRGPRRLDPSIRRMFGQVQNLRAIRKQRRTSNAKIEPPRPRATRCGHRTSLAARRYPTRAQTPPSGCCTRPER